jgi:hypothetical protein
LGKIVLSRTGAVVINAPSKKKHALKTANLPKIRIRIAEEARKEESILAKKKPIATTTATDEAPKRTATTSNNLSKLVNGRACLAFN